MWPLCAQLSGTNYLPTLLQWVDKENLPEYLGGTSTATLLDDAGPWQDPKVVAEIDAERQQREHSAVEEEPHEGATLLQWVNKDNLPDLGAPAQPRCWTMQGLAGPKGGSRDRCQARALRG